MLKEFEFEFTAIDDSDPKTSLISMQKNIKDNLLLICNGEIYDILEKNVKKCGITNYENAFLYFAKFIANNLKNTKLEFIEEQNIIKLKPNPVITLFDEFYITYSMFLNNQILTILHTSFDSKFKSFKSPLPKRKLSINLCFSKKNKHLGNIDNKFIDILYIFNSQKDYETNKDSIKNGLIVPSVLTELVSNSDFILTLNYPSFRTYKSTVAFLPHSFHPFLVATRFFRSNDSYKQYIQNVYFRDLDYIFISSNLENEILKDNLNDSFDQLQKVVKAGYPSLDFNIANKKTSKNADIVLFAYSFLDDLLNHSDLEWILNDLKKRNLKVALRYHAYYKNHNMMQKLNKLKLKFNLLIDDMTNYDILNKTKVLVSDLSSISHTFSLTYLRKSVIFAPFGRYFNGGGYSVSWPDTSYQIECFTKESLVENIADLMQSSNEKSLEIYRDKSVYNLGHSSEFIANFILEKLKEK
ncbi:hypothetical protein RVY88_06270 [Campylobacter sp. TJR-1]|nr:hypothetical protein [Campylobacter sp. TJR-1]